LIRGGAWLGETRFRARARKRDCLKPCGGIVCALLTGVFAIEQYGGTAGLIEGNAMQVVNQIEGIVIVFVYAAVVSLIILKIIDIFIGLRVSDEVEREGLDLALHGETVH
jgi:Amt family ammonium transporter